MQLLLDIQCFQSRILLIHLPSCLPFIISGADGDNETISRQFFILNMNCLNIQDLGRSNSSSHMPCRESQPGKLTVHRRQIFLISMHFFVLFCIEKLPICECVHMCVCVENKQLACHMSCLVSIHNILQCKYFILSVSDFGFPSHERDNLLLNPYS